MSIEEDFCYVSSLEDGGYVTYDVYIKRLSKDIRNVYHPKYGEGWSEDKYKSGGGAGGGGGGLLRVWFPRLQKEMKLPVSSFSHLAFYGTERGVYGTFWKKILYGKVGKAGGVGGLGGLGELSPLSGVYLGAHGDPAGRTLYSK